ncbi:MAG: phosphatase PAP2 family protein [Microbacterium sp.]
MRRRMLAGWGAGLLAAALLLGVVLVAVDAGLFGLDSWWNGFVAAYRSDGMVDFALVLNAIGGGWVAIFAVPLAVVVALLIARRWRAAVFAAMCFMASAGAVQLVKHLFGRARPDGMIVASDFGSFPSGHTANAATNACVAVVLIPRVWIAILGSCWTVAMALSRTFLSVHWATDTLGGALIGSAVVLLLAAWLLPWVRAVRLLDPTPRSVA